MIPRPSIQQINRMSTLDANRFLTIEEAYMKRAAPRIHVVNSCPMPTVQNKSYLVCFSSETHFSFKCWLTRVACCCYYPLLLQLIDAYDEEQRQTTRSLSSHRHHHNVSNVMIVQVVSAASAAAAAQSSINALRRKDDDKDEINQSDEWNLRMNAVHLQFFHCNQIFFFN